MKRIPLIDDAFLRLETRRMPLHVGMLMLFEPPTGSGRKFAEELAARLRSQVKTAPPFNQCLVERRGMHYWEEDDNFDLDQHFVHISLPEPGRVRELLALVSRVHPSHLDRAYPLWRMYLIEGLNDGRIAVYLKIHHAMVDGVGGMKMLIESMSTDRNASTRMPPVWSIGATRSEALPPLPVASPAAGGISAMRSLAREGILSSARSVATVFGELRNTFNDYRNHNPDLTVAGLAPRCQFNGKIGGSRRFAAQSYSMPRIRAVARAFDATSNDVILAMCSSALRRYLQARNELPEIPLIASIPVSVRGKGQQSDAANQVAFTMAHLATHLDDPLERMVAIKKAMDHNKQRMQKLSPGQLTTYEAMMMLPGVANSLLGFAPDRALANVCISHVPGPRQDLYWQGARLSGLYPVSLVTEGGALNITIISRHDLVDFGIIACRKTVPDVQHLLGYLEEGLVELEQALAKKTPPKAASGPGSRPRKARVTRPKAKAVRPKSKRKSRAAAGS